MIDLHFGPRDSSALRSRIRLWGRLPNLRTDCQSVHPGAARTNEATLSEHCTMGPQSSAAGLAWAWPAATASVGVRIRLRESRPGPETCSASAATRATHSSSEVPSWDRSWTKATLTKQEPARRNRVAENVKWDGTAAPLVASQPEQSGAFSGGGRLLLQPPNARSAEFDHRTTK
jgi:hypothetical protein